MADPIFSAPFPSGRDLILKPSGMSSGPVDYPGFVTSTAHSSNSSVFNIKKSGLEITVDVVFSPAR